MLNEHFNISDEQLARLEILTADYKKLYAEPDSCCPKIIVNTPVDVPTVQEQVNDPAIMLYSELVRVQSHLDLKDDFLPMVRVGLGTAQVASAFGCEIFYQENSLPAVKNHSLTDLGMVMELGIPDKYAGQYKQLREYTEYYLENIPDYIPVQHPDIQSPFNSAHLIRGNDIFMDMYDDPDSIDKLLNIITDFMLKQLQWIKSMISDDKEWFYDWGGLWKGGARISNCSSQMIGPEMYIEHVLPRDVRFMEAIGGGRMHYCGDNTDVVETFFKNKYIHALDYEGERHDLWHLCEIAPVDFTLFQSLVRGTEAWKRMFAGDWPDKKNIVIVIHAESLQEGEILLSDLRNACPYIP
jgi:hypothetical protein